MIRHHFATLAILAALGAGACESPVACWDEPTDPAECRSVLAAPLPEAPPGCFLLDPLEGEWYVCPEAPAEPVAVAI